MSLLQTQNKIQEQNFFDRQSPFSFSLDLGHLKNYYARVLAGFGLDSIPSSRILDAGCGTGFFSIQLAKIGHSVIGIDISRASLRCALELARPEKIDFQAILADIECLPIRSSSVEHVVALSLCHHFRKVNRAIQEISYVIKYGGCFYISEVNGLNPLIKLLNIVSNMFLLNHLVSRKIINPNEFYHSPHYYIKTLKQSGFWIQSIIYHYGRQPLPTPTLSNPQPVYRIFQNLRPLLYHIVQRFFGSKVGALDFFLIARRIRFDKFK